MPTKPTKRRLRKLLFENRRNIRELEKLGVSRSELRDAVRSVHADGALTTGDPDFAAVIIAAELADTAEVPTSIDWDKIIELINKLMPLIETWISMCV